MNTTLWEKKMATTDGSTHSYNPIKVINDVSKIIGSYLLCDVVSSTLRFLFYLYIFESWQANLLPVS